MFPFIALILGIFLFSVSSIVPTALADTWYPGKGLKEGDFFRYSVCTELMGCPTPPEFDFWVKNQTRDGTGWNLEFVTVDGKNTQRGSITIDSLSSDPLNFTPNLSEYATIFKNTIVWINHFSNKTQPKDFNNTQWGKWGPQGLDTIRFEGFTVGPIGEKQVTVKAGTFNAWVVDWRQGAGDIWIKPSLPFPVKGTLTNPFLGIYGPRIMFDFELLGTGNNDTKTTIWASNSSNVIFSAVEDEIPSEIMQQVSHMPQFSKDATYLNIEKRLHGYSGMYLDGTGKLNVFTTDPSIKSVDKSILADSVNPEDLAKGIVVKQSKHSWHKWIQLENILFQLLGQKDLGITMMGFDDINQVYQIGFEKLDDSRKAFMTNFLARHKIPQDMIQLIETGKMIPLGITQSNQFASPLKQIKSGISPENVNCNEGFTLIHKLEDNSPVCVTQQTAQKLVERGWGIIMITSITQQNMPVLSSLIKVNNTNFTINYSITGSNKLTSASLDNMSRTLQLLMNTPGNGTLELTLPRALIDAKIYENTDDKFIILADGQEIPYKEIYKTSNDRTLSIPFQQGVTKIEIIGATRI